MGGVAPSACATPAACAGGPSGCCQSDDFSGMNTSPATASRKYRGSRSAIAGELKEEWKEEEEFEWIQYCDEKSGVPYFHNVQTGETTWEAPHQFLVHPSVIDWMQEQDKDGSDYAGKKKKSAKKSISPGHRSPFPSAQRASVQKLTWNCESAMPRRKRMERVAVLCALEEEAVHMRALMENVHELVLIGCRRTRGTIKGTIVDLIVTEIGTTNAASAATALCLEDSPHPLVGILSVGCAGAHAEELSEGDIIICSGVTASGGDCRILPDGSIEYKAFSSSEKNVNIPRRVFEADMRLLEVARSVTETTKIPNWPGSSKTPSIYEGIVASSECWVQQTESGVANGSEEEEEQDDEQEQQQQHEDQGGKFKTLCEEMEAAAVAGVAAKFHVPFLGIKDVTNHDPRLKKQSHHHHASSSALARRSHHNHHKKKGGAGHRRVRFSAAVADYGDYDDDDDCDYDYDEIGRRAAMVAAKVIAEL